MKVGKLRQNLLRWYCKHRRPLPWRDNPTPYRVWISEIMLQQTQARTVIPYYSRFLERFPDVESLAGASEHDVLELWSGLGYYSRARNLHRAAKLIIGKHGEFPGDLPAILALPGIGRYTAGAICSLAFNQAQPVVDGNVRRVITRLEAIEDGAAEEFFWDRMSAWIPEEQPSGFNQAVMELGAMVCMPAHPLCSRCPVEELCEARRLGIQEKIPAVRTRRAVQQTQVAILILETKRRILLTSRQKLAIVPGEWGLPCSRVLHGESPRKAADALCRRIFGRALPLNPCAGISHSITHHRITAYGFFRSGNPRTTGLRETEGFRWATLPECGRLLTSSLFHKALLKYRAANAK
jgi:A/G-specific adenine glycosylase